MECATIRRDLHSSHAELGDVLKGFSDRSTLKTYQSERRKVAQDLIDFDHKVRP